MALMMEDGFPFPAMGLVHVRNSITQYRPIAEREQLNIKCYLGNLTQVEKGYEFSIFTVVSTGGERVWASESVNFFRGGGSGVKADKGSRGTPEPVTDAIEWKVPGNTGRRYGAVSGDRNPIHLYPLTAKLFGFKRQIAHGMWSRPAPWGSCNTSCPRKPSPSRCSSRCRCSSPPRSSSPANRSTAVSTSACSPRTASNRT